MLAFLVTFGLLSVVTSVLVLAALALGARRQQEAECIYRIQLEDKDRPISLAA